MSTANQRGSSGPWSLCLEFAFYIDETINFLDDLGTFCDLLCPSACYVVPQVQQFRRDVKRIVELFPVTAMPDVQWLRILPLTACSAMLHKQLKADPVS